MIWIVHALAVVLEATCVICMTIVVDSLHNIMIKLVKYCVAVLHWHRITKALLIDSTPYVRQIGSIPG